MTGQPLSEEREQEILELIADFPMPHGEGKRYVWPGIADELMAEIDRLRAEVARLEAACDFAAAQFDGYGYWSALDHLNELRSGGEQT